MRIRRSAVPALSPSPSPSSVSPSPSPSPSPPPSSSCSSSSSCFSTISTHSLSSSSNSTSTTTTTSSSSSFSLSPISSPTRSRCQGLDLLVKAVYHVVAGSVVGFPYIQKRVIRRRKRPLRFTNLVINLHRAADDEIQEHVEVEEEEEEEEEGEVFDSSNLTEEEQKKKKKKRREKSRRSMALPSKYHDSVLQSWKPRDRRKRRRSS